MRKLILPFFVSLMFLSVLNLYSQSNMNKVPETNIGTTEVFSNILGTEDTTITTFPHVESFDGADFLPNGWTQSSTPTVSLWGRVTAGTNPTTTPKDGTHMLRYNCYNFSVGTSATLVSPGFTFPAGTYKVKFWMYRDAGYATLTDRLEVLYNTSNDPATATSLGIINRAIGLAPVVAAAGWYEYSFELPNTTQGTDRRLFFKAISDYGNNIFVDKITIEEVSNTAVGWCNVQWPLSHTMTAGEQVTVYTQAWIDNVTSVAGATPNLECWIGVSSTNTDPSTWTNWVPATFNVDAGNNDEFMANIGASLAPGTYYYASKYVYLGGPAKFGGNGGFWDAVTHPSCELTVNPVMVSNFPMTEGFEGATFPPAGWVKEDLNAGSTWLSSTSAPHSGLKKAEYNYNGTIPGNDYLFTPALVLQAGKVYSVSYYYKSESATYTEKMKIVLGDGASAAQVDSVLFDHTSIANTTYANNVVKFSVATTGNYYIGFHAYSLPDMWKLSLDDITISEVYPDDYMVTQVTQKNAIPNPFKLEDKKANLETTFELKDANFTLSNLSNNYVPVYSSDDNSTQINVNNAEGYSIVDLFGVIKNVGLNANSFTVNPTFNSVPGSPISRPGLAPDGVDTVTFAPVPTNRGTFTATYTVVNAGDTLGVANNTLSNNKVLVYPDPMIKIKYDNGSNLPSTYIGFGTNNLPLTAAVRYTATENMRLANVDAFYRNDAVSSDITVKVYAAGADTNAPGTLIYTKSFNGVNYLNPGTAGTYVTLPLGNDAPTFLVGTDFWVGIAFDAAIQFPMGAHSTTPTKGRSYLTNNDTLWSPVIISTTEYAWLLRVVGTPYTPPQYNTLWTRSQAQSNMPAWFSTTSLERGIAYGNATSPVETSNSHLYVASRNGGNIVKILNAETGVDIGDLDATGISGGTFAINDIGTTFDGKIIAANLSINVTTSAFKVYMWDNETSAPVNIISYIGTDAVRLGDKITVTGDFSAGTATIYAGSATSGFQKVYKWTMTAGAFNTTPTVISLSDNASGVPTSASIGPLPNGDFYWKATGYGLKKYLADGTYVDVIPTTVVASGGNAVRYIGEVGDNEFVAVFQYGAGNENCRILQVPKTAVNTATTFELTPSLGTTSNPNGTGDIAYKLNPDGTADIFVMSTNNGLGAYRTTSPIPVSLTSFVAMANESNVILNWVTITETNSQEFVIERKNNENWSAIGRIAASGTSTEPREYTYTDKVAGNGTYSYRLKMVDYDGSFEYSAVVEVVVGVPATFQLSQNYPNPFNPSTRINYSLPVDSKVTFELYDITGQKVATLFNAEVKAGFYNLDFASDNFKLSSGVYIYRMTATSLVDGKSFINSKKLMLLK